MHPSPDTGAVRMSNLHGPTLDNKDAHSGGLQSYDVQGLLPRVSQGETRRKNMADPVPNLYDRERIAKETSRYPSRHTREYGV